MGVNGLSAWLLERFGQPHEPSPPGTPPRILVCDGLALVCKLYQFSVDWIRSGQWEYGACVARITQNFVLIYCVVVFNYSAGTSATVCVVFRTRQFRAALGVGWS
jgi:hypothetical protein